MSLSLRDAPAELSSRELLLTIRTRGYPPGRLLPYLEVVRQRTWLPPTNRLHISHALLLGYLAPLVRRRLRPDIMALVLQLVFTLPRDTCHILVPYLNAFEPRTKVK